MSSDKRDPLAHDEWFNIDGTIYVYNLTEVAGKKIASVYRMSSIVAVIPIPEGTADINAYLEAETAKKLNEGTDEDDDEDEPENPRGESDFRGEELT